MTQGSFSIQVDARAAEDVSRWFKFWRRDQLPFVTSKAINLTLNDVRRAEVGQAFSKFKLRSKTFPRQAVKTEQSSKSQWPKVHGRVYVPEKFPFLLLQETGGVKRPAGLSRIAVPTRLVREKKSGGPVARDRPRAVRQRKGAYVGGDKKNQIRYTQKKGPEWRQRLGIYYTLHQSVQIKPRFRFEQTGKKVIDKVWFKHFEREYTDSIKPPKPRVKRTRGLPG